MSDQLIRIQDELVSYFLCEYSPVAPKKKLTEIVREYAARKYSNEYVETFVSEKLDSLRSVLVDEFNARSSADRALRFEVVDPAAEGHILRGYKKEKSDARLAFQDALNELSPNHFESLAAVVLKHLDCDSTFTTPQSHDQGVDAFGYRAIFPSLSRAVSHQLVWIAQAKHYKKFPISTNVVRELVGTGEMLLSRIFSTVDERYKELELKPYGPTALLLVTTHEFPSTVRRLAERAGAFVLEASDLYDLIGLRIKSPVNVAALESFITSEMAGIPRLH